VTVIQPDEELGQIRIDGRKLRRVTVGDSPAGRRTPGRLLQSKKIRWFG
jgi:hypothetical protein